MTSPAWLAGENEAQAVPFRIKVIHDPARDPAIGDDVGGLFVKGPAKCSEGFFIG